MLHQMFKSVIDQDRAAVVICDTEHTIVYMNPAAVQNYFLGRYCKMYKCVVLRQMDQMYR